MQPITAQDFTYNLLVCKYLRGFPPIPLKMGILRNGGGGASRPKSRCANAKGTPCGVPFLVSHCAQCSTGPRSYG